MSSDPIQTLVRHFNPENGCCRSLVDPVVKTIHDLGLDTNKIWDCKGYAYDLKIKKNQNAVFIYLVDENTAIRVRELSDVVPKAKPKVTTPVKFNCVIL